MFRQRGERQREREHYGELRSRFYRFTGALKNYIYRLRIIMGETTTIGKRERCGHGSDNIKLYTNSELLKHSNC